MAKNHALLKFQNNLLEILLNVGDILVPDIFFMTKAGVALQLSTLLVWAVNELLMHFVSESFLIRI